MAQWRSEARTQENHKQKHDEPDHKHWSGTDYLKQIEERPVI